MSRRRVLVIGSLQPDDQPVIEASCQEAGFIVDFRVRVDDGITSLRKLGPDVLLLELETAGAERFCRFLRTSDKYGSLPAIALSRKINDLAFASALRWGLDDVVPHGSAHALVMRLNSIPKTLVKPPVPQGQAVIADRDNARAGVLARLFRGAGYQTVFAQSQAELRAHIERQDTRLFVLASEFGTVPELLAERPRSALWVVVARPRETGQLAEQFADEPNLTVVNGYGNPENVLYASNELGSTEREAERLEPRTVYGTVCDFRSAGDERDETGFTYNVSANGIYLRSLAIPRADRIWLELRPPRGPRRVRLLAEIVWRRDLGDPGPHTAPPGCGLRIVDGLADDLTDWRRHVSMLAEQHSDSVIAHRSKLGLGPPSGAPVSIPRPSPILSVGSSKTPPPAPTSEEIDDILAPLDHPKPTEDVAAPATPPEPPPTDSGSMRGDKPPALPTQASDTDARAAPPLPKREPSAETVARAEVAGRNDAAERADEAPDEQAAPARAPLEEPTEASLVVPGVPRKRKSDKFRSVMAAAAVVVAVGIGATLGLKRSAREAPDPADSESATQASATPGPSKALQDPASTIPEAVGDDNAEVSGEGSPSDGPVGDEPAGDDPKPDPSAASEQHAGGSAGIDEDNRGGAGTPLQAEQVDNANTNANAGGGSSEAEGSGTDEEQARQLPPEFGYLFVRSSLDTKVFVHGQLAGVTNERLKIRCGPKFIRLGESLGKWQTEGQMAQLHCRRLTTLEINEPQPADE